MNPGSKEALAKGCTCPVLDNNHGKGMWNGREHLYWQAYGCPVHSPQQQEKVDDN